MRKVQRRRWARYVSVGKFSLSELVAISRRNGMQCISAQKPDMHFYHEIGLYGTRQTMEETERQWKEAGHEVLTRKPRCAFGVYLKLKRADWLDAHQADAQADDARMVSHRIPELDRLAILTALAGGNATELDGAQMILIERLRQVTEEGWTAEHDDQHTEGQLAMAGAAYALVDAENYFFEPAKIVWPWDWDLDFWKPKDRICNLVRAGAFIAAEIDRLKRTAKLTGELRQSPDEQERFEFETEGL